MTETEDKLVQDVMSILSSVYYKYRPTDEFILDKIKKLAGILHHEQAVFLTIAYINLSHAVALIQRQLLNEFNVDVRSLTQEAFINGKKLVTHETVVRELA
jgi:hypothetical protein